MPALGRIRVGRLTPQHFQRLHQDKLAAGLSHTTVSHLHTVLHGAFAEAVRWGLLPRNVVSLVRPLRKAHVEVVALTVEQARALLAAAAGNRKTFHALRHTAATMLLSEGEHPKVVQELLGHAQVSITQDCSSHMTPRLMSNAAVVMDRLSDEEV